jgi:hypothetical protein
MNPNAYTHTTAELQAARTVALAALNCPAQYNLSQAADIARCYVAWTPRLAFMA